MHGWSWILLSNPVQHFATASHDLLCGALGAANPGTQPNAWVTSGQIRVWLLEGSKGSKGCQGTSRFEPWPSCPKLKGRSAWTYE